MTKDEINVGMVCMARVGSRLARVSVIRDKGGRGRRWVCRTLDTNREILCSSQRLRPLCGSTKRQRPVKGPVPFDGVEGDAVICHSGPVGNVCKDVSNGTIRALSLFNKAMVTEIVDRTHVAESFRFIARRVKAQVARKTIWKTIPRALRRGLLYFAAARHASNRKTYAQVMRHDPLPSPRMVAEAVGNAFGIPCPR